MNLSGHVSGGHQFLEQLTTSSMQCTIQHTNTDNLTKAVCQVTEIDGLQHCSLVPEPPPALPLRWAFHNAPSILYLEHLGFSRLMKLLPSRGFMRRRFGLTPLPVSRGACFWAASQQFSQILERPGSVSRI